MTIEEQLHTLNSLHYQKGITMTLLQEVESGPSVTYFRNSIRKALAKQVEDIDVQIDATYRTFSNTLRLRTCSVCGDRTLTVPENGAEICRKDVESNG